MNREEIRIVKAEEITRTVCELLLEANHILPIDVVQTIERFAENESSPLACSVLGDIRENIRVAAELGVPICQDTGMAVVFAEIGNRVVIDGEVLRTAVDRGVREAYLDGKMRCSVVGDPLYDRKNTDDNTPAVLYTELVEGDQIKLTVLPKGFGSENMSACRMLLPSSEEEDIIDFAVETVKRAGSNPCPPIVLGIGIGGTFDHCAVLSKKALARPLDATHPDPRYAALEEKILARVNALGLGPQGFGGKTTALAVSIETYPTHIAGLPVAVNVCCHVMRHATAVI